MKFYRLIEAHKHAEIIDYVKNCKCLASYEELALIERGHHDEIMAYIAKHYFDVENYMRFLERGHLNEIRFYILRHGIYYGTKTERNLEPYLKNIANELVISVLNHIQICSLTGVSVDTEMISSYECLIIKSGDHCALRRYLSQIQQTLQPAALKLFKMKGYTTAEDLQVAQLCGAI